MFRLCGNRECIVANLYVRESYSIGGLLIWKGSYSRYNNNLWTFPGISLMHILQPCISTTISSS